MFFIAVLLQVGEDEIKINQKLDDLIVEGALNQKSTTAQHFILSIYINNNMGEPMNMEVYLYHVPIIYEYGGIFI